MTWYADDMECDFFGAELAPSIHAIGWLDQAKPFEIGDTPESVFKSLQVLLQNPSSSFVSPGVHVCNLCQYSGETGNTTLLVPGNGVLYFCPELILHYVSVHWYKPPEEFCQAVLECPPPNSMEYKKRLLANGGRKLVQNKVISL